LEPAGKPQTAVSNWASSGTYLVHPALAGRDQKPNHQDRVPVRRQSEKSMNSIIYIVGLIVVVLVILSFLGLR
jgi:hypothetical protein